MTARAQAGVAGGLLVCLAAVLAGSVSEVLAQQPPEPSPAGWDGRSKRTPVDAGSAPWRGVGRLQIETGGWCTGALVGPRTVLTAAHCLFGRGTGNTVQPGSIHFLVGYRGGEYAGHARASSFVIGPGFAIGVRGRPLPSVPWDADWAVVTLEHPLGTADRVLAVAAEPPPPGTRLALGGYDQDRAHALTADTACVSVGLVEEPTGRSMLRHSCASTRGSSGAPVLAQTADGGWRVVGVASLTAERAPGGYAVPIASINATLLAAGR